MRKQTRTHTHQQYDWTNTALKGTFSSQCREDAVMMHRTVSFLFFRYSRIGVDLGFQLQRCQVWTCICLRSLWMAKPACGLRFWHTLEEETTRIYQAQGLDRLDVNFYDITSIKFKTLSPPDPRYQQTSMTSQLTETPQRSAKIVKVALACMQGMNRLDCTLVAKYSKQNTKMLPQHRKRRVWAPAMSSRSPICSRKATTSGEDRPVRAKQRLEGARKRESISSTCPINFQFNIYIYMYIYIYI